MGLLLIGTAMVAAADLQAPMPMPGTGPSSAIAGSKLLPRALQPVGWVGTRRPRFCWSWSSQTADFDFVLLDEGLDEVHRQRVRGCEVVAAGTLAARLARGERFHWYVEATIDGRLVASAPVAFGFAR
jgi:hypothetical protein